MRFSFSLIQKLAPGKYDRKTLIEEISLHAFEVVSSSFEADGIEIAVPPNRYSDAASHLGVARETAILFNVKLEDPTAAKITLNSGRGVPRVSIQDKNLCRRYLAAYVENVKIGPSPTWLKKVLETCGLRSVNNVVDIMNYVMLETGQPLHAFDADKISGGIIVRRADKGEKIETIDPIRSRSPQGDRSHSPEARAASNGVDNQKFVLDENILIIADSKKPLAIAGIKGGKSGEIIPGTKRIVIESANFDGANVYQASRALGLQTDASIRFSHNLSPELAAVGMLRALVLLKELASAKIYKPVDIYSRKQPKKVMRLDIARINRLVGADYKEKDAVNILRKLGFQKRGNNLEAPLLRTDIDDLEDVAEEIARFKGYDNLKPQPPKVVLGAAQEEEFVLLKDRVRSFLISAGFNEMYNYSLVGENDVAMAPAVVFGDSAAAVRLANPMSRQFSVLRDSLASGLLKNIKDNLRFFETARIFEIGKIFSETGNEVKETTALGVALSTGNAVLELKGLIDALFQQLGVVDYFFPPLNEKNKFLSLGASLRIETGDHRILGYLGSLEKMTGAMLEVDLGKLLSVVKEEKEFEALPKFPSIMRDISILVNNDIAAGDILSLIQQVSPQWVQDVDLIDWYQDEKLGDNKKSLTFRIVFQAEDRTLTDAEADREIAAINQVITEKFNAELR